MGPYCKAVQKYFIVCFFFSFCSMTTHLPIHDGSCGAQTHLELASTHFWALLCKFWFWACNRYLVPITKRKNMHEKTQSVNHSILRTVDPFDSDIFFNELEPLII
jgi:hypothetical protein